MFDKEIEDNDEQQIMGGTIEMMRDHALKLFARAVAEMTQNPVMTTVPLEHQRQFLSVDETETIVREHSAPGTPPGMYAIGGETKDEFNAQMRKLFVALMTRIEANVAQYGVSRGYLDCAFDDEANDFVFSISEKGQAVVDEIRKTPSTKPSNN